MRQTPSTWRTRTLLRLALAQDGLAGSIQLAPFHGRSARSFYTVHHRRNIAKHTFLLSFSMKVVIFNRICAMVADTQPAAGAAVTLEDIFGA